MERLTAEGDLATLQQGTGFSGDVSQAASDLQQEGTDVGQVKSGAAQGDGRGGLITTALSPACHSSRCSLS